MDWIDVQLGILLVDWNMGLCNNRLGQGGPEGY